MMEFLNSIGPMHWMAVALAILVFELLTGSTYLLWPAASAFLVAILSGLGLTPGILEQVASFAALTILLTVVGGPFVARLRGASGPTGLNDPGERLIGQVGTVVVDFAGGEGRIKLGDTEWQANADAAKSLPAGTQVRVKSCNGPTLEVEPS
jgi:inner membrane protein